jgi:hypothetical protein
LVGATGGEGGAGVPAVGEGGADAVVVVVVVLVGAIGVVSDTLTAFAGPAAEPPPTAPVDNELSAAPARVPPTAPEVPLPEVPLSAGAAPAPEPDSAGGVNGVEGTTSAGLGCALVSGTPTGLLPITSAAATDTAAAAALTEAMVRSRHRNAWRAPPAATAALGATNAMGDTGDGRPKSGEAKTSSKVA